MIDKTTLKQEADKLFASTSYEVLWGSPAGEFFTSEKIGSLSLKEGQKLIKFEKTETKELNANDTIAKIKAVTSLEALKEFEGDERKSVKSVYDWKQKQLTEAINVVGAKTVGTAPAVAGNGNTDTDTKK
ncbi:hypothetical protein [Flavobacterium aquicola]|uniref:Uncharacterized protein n=1 Tax=Flavobacterium aquicola TaxID=1682742 RepID=A0A3E0ER70_9FLAO|nr:hypothetical protein [Flavobacterium aquicola]REH00274.1 hypothetical protein C8P67_103250 [Flavobacterium aquicola]